MFNSHEHRQTHAWRDIQRERKIILFAGVADEGLIDATQRSLGAHYSVVSIAHAREAMQWFSNCAAVCVGRHCSSEMVSLVFTALEETSAALPCVVLVSDTDEEFLRECRTKTNLFYAMPPSSPVDDIIAILSSAASYRYGVGSSLIDQNDHVDAVHLFRARALLDIAREVILQDDLAAACELVAESLAKVFDSECGCCLNYDAETRSLTGASSMKAVEFRLNVSTGIIGFVTLTGRAACVACLEEDPRYAQGIDDLGGGDQARLLACPVRDVRGRTLAILSLIRAASNVAFSEQDEKAILLLARHLAVPMKRLNLEAQTEETYGHLRDITLVGASAYRTEAMARYAGGIEATGDLLHLSPSWTRWVYWLLLMCIGAALLYSSLAKVTEYAAGPAVILFSGYIHGVVPVDCRPHTAEQTHPTMASALFGERRPSLIAFIPGKYRPELQAGMNLRLTLSGFQYMHQMLTVNCVGDQVVSPAQVKRYLPSESAYTVTLSGPVVPVFATLPAKTFQANSRRYAYYDGMGATAEVKTDSERLIYALVPGLKRWISQHGD